jgi:hypothetical protein
MLVITKYCGLPGEFNGMDWIGWAAIPAWKRPLI